MWHRLSFRRTIDSWNTLERDSEWLQQQLGQYAPISGDFVTKFAYEEYATPTASGGSIMVCTSTTMNRLRVLSGRRWSRRHQPLCRDTQTLSRL
jgi:hypothetical protein